MALGSRMKLYESQTTSGQLDPSLPYIGTSVAHYVCVAVSFRRSYNLFLPCSQVGRA